MSVAELLDRLLADDYVSVFDENGNTQQISKQDLIDLITKESN